MPIPNLDDFNYRDFDGTDASLGHAAGAQYPLGAGRSLAEAIRAIHVKVDEVIDDGVNALPLTSSVLTAPSELTIATGAVTITKNFHTIDTEADAASDDLDTITGGTKGQIIVFAPASDARSVVVKHGTGNIQCNGGVDITLAEDDDVVLLIKITSTVWAALAVKTLAQGDVSAVSFQTASEVTIATGAITITKGNHTVDTEADAASDDLDTITGGGAGDLLVLTASDDARSVVVRDTGGGTGNIRTPGAESITLAEDDDYVLLVRGTTNWTVLALKTLAAAGGGLGTKLGSTANAKGASLVSIEDAAALITATTVEAALLEHQNRLSTNVITDPGNAGAIPVTRSGSCAMTSAGAETRTLAIPSFKGQRLVLYVDTYVGNIVITSAQSLNVAANTIMTFSAVRKTVILEAITVGAALRWQITNTADAPSLS